MPTEGIDLTQPPYHDRFGKTEYEKILFRADRPLQAAELTELQSIQESRLAKTSAGIFVDGDIQDGMEYSINSDGDRLTVSDGFVYLDGSIREFKEQTIPFDPDADVYHVRVDIEEEIVTHEDAPDLLDPLTNTPNHFSPGADRLKKTVILSETEGVSIYEFREGDLHVHNTGNRQISQLNDILAERTHDESGSYKVRGFTIYSENHPSNDNLLNVVVDAGRAYVMGYQVDKPTATRVPVPKATDVETINSEAFFYNNTTRRGQLGSSPVADVNRVTGQVQVTRENVNRSGTSGGTDSLANNSVVSIVRVWREENGDTVATYQQGRDFQLRNGNSIDWSPDGNEPPAGTTYYATYIYNRTMVRDTDYRVVTEGSMDNRRTFIDFNQSSGARPVPDSMVMVDYEYYLAREDLILLDKDGEVYVQEGQPDSLGRVKKPNVEDPYSLILGSITIYPNSSTTIPHASTIIRLSMQDLQNLRNRIVNLEYNQAVNALDNPAMEDANPVTLRGVFSDGFISMQKYDTGHPDARIGFSFEDAHITLPVETAHKTKPHFLQNSSNAHTWGRLVTAPFEEELAISQPRATDTINVNPYDTFNIRASLKLDPSEDNWVDEENVVVMEERDGGIMQVRQWWRHPNASWAEDERERLSNITLDDDMSWEDMDSNNVGTIIEPGKWRWDTDVTTSTMSSGGQRTQESIIDFMRQIDVSFECKNLLPNSNNLTLFFDGHRVPITPASGFNAGSETGTIRANGQGIARGTFTIPKGVRTGTREVILENGDNTGVSTFVAHGQKKIVEDVIIRTYQTVQLVDPLAQSIQFRENRVITSWEIFCASKDNTKNLTAQIRGISEGGQPNKTVYAETVLTPSEINVSDDASLPTKITWDDPLMVDAGKEYCLVLLTDSDQYTIWIATRGETDINTGARITSNPYLTGVLYSSSNASAWTIHQDSDMKFNVYTANFNETATMVFDTMSDIPADSVVLMSTFLTPQNTGCVWHMKIVMDNEPDNVTIASKPWLPIINYEEIDLNQIAREVQLRAIFRASRYVSPLLSLQDILLSSFLSSLSGSYVSKTIDMSEGAEWNTIRFSYEAYTPGTSTVVARFSTDGGNSWETFQSTPETVQQSSEFVRYVYEEKVTEDINGHDSLKVRLDLQTANSFIRPRCRRLMVNVNME